MISSSSPTPRSSGCSSTRVHCPRLLSQWKVEVDRQFPGPRLLKPFQRVTGDIPHPPLGSWGHRRGTCCWRRPRRHLRMYTTTCGSVRGRSATSTSASATSSNESHTPATAPQHWWSSPGARSRTRCWRCWPPSTTSSSSPRSGPRTATRRNYYRRRTLPSRLSIPRTPTSCTFSSRQLYLRRRRARQDDGGVRAPQTRQQPLFCLRLCVDGAARNEYKFTRLLRSRSSDSNPLCIATSVDSQLSLAWFGHDGFS